MRGLQRGRRAVGSCSAPASERQPQTRRTRSQRRAGWVSARAAPASQSASSAQPPGPGHLSRFNAHRCACTKPKAERKADIDQRLRPLLLVRALLQRPSAVPHRPPSCNKRERLAAHKPMRNRGHSNPLNAPRRPDDQVLKNQWISSCVQSMDSCTSYAHVTNFSAFFRWKKDIHRSMNFFQQ